MKRKLLKIISAEKIKYQQRTPIDKKALSAAKKIVFDVEKRGEIALREYAERFGDVRIGGPLYLDKNALKKSLNEVGGEERKLLERTAERIRNFALRQKECLRSLEATIPGGKAGHSIIPLKTAGCYAPGGRFPLPSSVLMTAVTARAAGVEEVWVASPKPSKTTLASAAIAGADGMLLAGGAQAVSALTFGSGPVPRCDIICGPGNKYVTAAKFIASEYTSIDMLAGPSELAVFADDSADPAVVSADLLAQAEHDPDAMPILISLSRVLVHSVNEALEKQLPLLNTRAIASEALKNGFAVVAEDIFEAAEICNRIAPEHLELQLKDIKTAIPLLNSYGALFIGGCSAEVLGDYGAGPNHVLPTGGAARYTGGLSVFNFLSVRTWMSIERSEEAQGLVSDAVALAEIEGLSGHAQAGRIRLKKEINA